MTAMLGLRGHIKALFSEPSLLWEAIRAGSALRRRRRLGISRAYLEWRMYTAYGSHNDRATDDDVVHYLRWRRQMRRLARWEHVA